MVKQHNIRLQELGFIEPVSEIQVQYVEGETQEVTMSDGSILVLKKLDSKRHDIHNKMAAMELLHSHRASGKILTGLFYFNPATQTVVDSLNLPEKPLAWLDETDTRPPVDALEKMMQPFS